jgi:hypothetical protein
MAPYRVFLGAPSRAETQQARGSYHWQTVSSKHSPSAIFPPATLESADRRISLIYQNIIFKESEEEEQSINDESLHGQKFVWIWFLV